MTRTAAGGHCNPEGAMNLLGRRADRGMHENMKSAAESTSPVYHEWQSIFQ